MLCFPRVAQKFQLDLILEMQALDFRRNCWRIQGEGDKQPLVGITQDGSQGWCLLSVRSWATVTLHMEKVHVDGQEHLQSEPALKGLEGVCAEQLWRGEGDNYGLYFQAGGTSIIRALQLAEGVFARKVCVRGGGESGRGGSWRWWEGREGALTSPHSPDCVPIWRSGISTLTT